MDLSVFLRLFNILEATAPNISLVGVSSGGRDSIYVNDCRGSFGCFPTGGIWEGPERPVPLNPGFLRDIDPFFCLHSAMKPNCTRIPVVNEYDIFIDKKLNLSPSSYLLVIAHGFLHSVDTDWVKKMVSSLLHKYDDHLRVLTLDWRKGAGPPYAQAAANTRILGAVTGRLLELFIGEYHVEPARIHLIGHSLGAHLFGYSGTFLKKRKFIIGRITGMDPAGPYYKGTPKEIRLDSADAYLVDIIHTDSTQLIPSLPMSLGLTESSGHFDFFPNGGTEQNGCVNSPQQYIMAENDLSKGILEYVTCSHERSHRFFTSSIAANCVYIGVECPSWKDFKKGRCFDCLHHRCFTMGVGIQRIYPQNAPAAMESNIEDISNEETQIQLYLATTNNENQCGRQLRFTLIPSSSKESVNGGGDFAKFSLVLRGTSGTTKFIPFKESQHVKPGVNISWVEAIPEIGDIHSIVFTPNDDDGFLKILWPTSLTSVLHLKQIVVDHLLQKRSLIFRFCNEVVVSGQSSVLKINDGCSREKYKSAKKTDHLYPQI